MTNEEICVWLKAEAEPKFQKFTSGLIPGTDPIIGVRIPKLRTLAKKIALPLAGDAGVKLEVAELMKEIGFVPYDAGDLAGSKKFQADTNLFLFAGNHAELAQKFK